MVGGGIAGLVAAAQLARAGARVTLLEQNDRVGGRCQSVARGGYRWDTGPSLLLFPDTYRRAFEAVGARLEDHVDVRRVEPAAYRVFFSPPAAGGGGGSGSSGSSSTSGASSGSSGSSTSGSGESTSASSGGGFTSLDLLYDAQRMVQQLEAVEAGAGAEYLAWLAAARSALVMGTENFIARDVEGVGDLLDPARLLPLLGRVDVLELLGQHHWR